MEGDQVLVNNYTMLHGRESFTNERELWRVQQIPPSENIPDYFKTNGRNYFSHGTRWNFRNFQITVMIKNPKNNELYANRKGHFWEGLVIGQSPKSLFKFREEKAVTYAFVGVEAPLTNFFQWTFVAGCLFLFFFLGTWRFKGYFPAKFFPEKSMYILWKCRIVQDFIGHFLHFCRTQGGGQI